MFLWVGQRVMRDQRRDVSQLGRFGAKEFAARRRVEEEIGGGDGGAAWEGGIVNAQYLSARDFDVGAGRIVSGCGVESDASYRSDRGQRLTAKPERCN